MDDRIKSALDAAGTAADYSARATYQRGYDAGVLDAKNTISVCGECDAAEARAEKAEALAKDRGGELELCWCVATESSPDDAPDPFPAGMAYKAVDAQQDREYAAEARALAAEAREWALGVQVVAQAARLKLAEAVVDEARYGQPTLAMRQALAAWDTVPGMEP